MTGSLASAPSVALTAMLVWLAATFAGLIGQPWSRKAAALLCAMGCAVCIGASLEPNGSLELPAWLGLAGLRWSFAVDGLSRWFLFLIGFVGLAVSIYAPDYLNHLQAKGRAGMVWSGLSALFASMVGVVIVPNAIGFFVFWELMALSSFLLVASEHERQSVRRAALIYLGATRIGTGFLMAGFVWAHASTGSWLFQDWHFTAKEGFGPAILILVGLLVKGGSWPFHLWLPIAHPAAPSPVSAVMSGVMIKTAIYGIFRIYVLGGSGSDWIGCTILILGAISSLWGVIFALLQHDLKKLLAYHSVENIGIILMAAGLSVVARGQGLPLVADLAAAAGLFHTLNHGVFKSLLFLATGTIDMTAHTRELDKLGGLIRLMPWTAAVFLTGSVAICALPPLNGFASEWLLYRSLLELASSAPTGEIRFVGILGMGWLALVGALALACFSKAFGICFLGQPRSRQAEHAKEGSSPMLGAKLALAVACLGLGVAAPAVWGVFWDFGMVGRFEVQQPSVVPVALAVFAVFGLLLLVNRRLAKSIPTKTFTTWDCGFGPLSPSTQYTATSFAQPIARLFGSLYKYEVSVAVEGDEPTPFARVVSVKSTHEPYLESRVYGPLLQSVNRFAEKMLMRLQAGSIHQYLLFMMIALAVMLWLGGLR